VEEDRLSARAAKEYIAALVAGGEREQALQFALAHQKLVRGETGREADPEIIRWIEQIRGAKRDTPLPPPIHEVVVPDDEDATRKRRLARVSSALGRRYRIEQLREAGAMLETYTAVAVTALGPEVEVHVVRPTAAATSDTSRFVASLKRASLLAHPKVLAIFDVELSNDLLYFVSARRGGRSLRERLRHERALPMRDALRIGRDIVAALAHAHERGVHHGDLRPKHVSLVGESAVVGGFGVFEGLSPDIDTSGRTTIAAWGSPTYLSPEQLLGDVHVDARSDVYSAGCILYEMLAGEPPFGRQRSAAVVAKKLTESPARLRTLRESVPEAIEDIVHHCLMRVPADRFTSGNEVAQALAGLEAPI
jgi:serine/threonine-protein kinase